MRICTQCIRSGAVVKRVRTAPFKLPAGAQAKAGAATKTGASAKTAPTKAAAKPKAAKPAK
jgi:hypothetical protein